MVNLITRTLRTDLQTLEDVLETLIEFVRGHHGGTRNHAEFFQAGDISLSVNGI